MLPPRMPSLRDVERLPFINVWLCVCNRMLRWECSGIYGMCESRSSFLCVHCIFIVSLKIRIAKTSSCIYLRPLTDMVHGSGAEPWVETLGTQRLEVLNDPGPQVQHIIPEQFLS